MELRSHRLHWIIEPLEELPSFLEGRMFGCLACYVHGRLQFVLADGEEPWNGLMVVTYREHHASLVREFPLLCCHPVLGKWLYARQDTQEFEMTAAALVRAAYGDDPRLGILPEEKTRRRRGKGSARTKRRSSDSRQSGRRTR